jgi:hypothetical protein
LLHLEQKLASLTPSMTQASGCCKSMTNIGKGKMYMSSSTSPTWTTPLSTSRLYRFDEVQSTGLSFK